MSTTVQRWDQLNGKTIDLFFAIEDMRKQGPEQLFAKDAYKIASEFRKLMLDYGYPNYAPQLGEGK